MSLPEFLHDIIKDEILQIQKELLRKVAKQYNLSEEKLFSEMLQDNASLHVVSNTDIKVEIIRKQMPRKSVPDSERCIARIWNRGKGGQCTRRISNSDHKMCTHHCKEYDANGKLRHGTMNDTPPKDLFSTNIMRKSVHK